MQHNLYIYRMFIKYCVLNYSSSAAALVFYLPGMCTHTETKGKQSPEYSKIFGKNTIFNEHPVLKIYSDIIIISQSDLLPISLSSFPGSFEGLKTSFSQLCHHGYSCNKMVQFGLEEIMNLIFLCHYLED